MQVTSSRKDPCIQNSMRQNCFTDTGMEDDSLEQYKKKVYRTNDYSLQFSY